MPRPRRLRSITAVLENADGSVSCVVGAIDLPSRTVWRVNVRLPKDAAYLETEVLLVYPTSLHDSLYNWLTSAQDVGEDLKYYYPGTHYIRPRRRRPPLADPRERPAMPHTTGITISAGSKSYHILGELGETFGGYYEKSGFWFTDTGPLTMRSPG